MDKLQCLKEIDKMKEITVQCPECCANTECISFDNSMALNCKINGWTIALGCKDFVSARPQEIKAT
jgi:hypothetical protein